MLERATSVRVLLVDDDQIFRNFARQALDELHGVEVREAGNGLEACHLLQKAEAAFDLIISDIFMPDMDGMEFLHALAALRYRGKLTIMSGGDSTILEIARTYAVQSGLQLAGAFPKESVTALLLRAILNFD
jgi:CheY-like chemotaxis protein